MAFEALAAHLPRLSALPLGDAKPIPAAPIGSFGDDIVLPSGERMAVRVVARGSNGRVVLDFRDSDPAGSEGFGLSPDDVLLASLLAVCHALGLPPNRGWEAQIDILLDRGSWIGAGPAVDPGRHAMSLARTFDAVLGALATSWPTRVGSGSCTVGALIELTCDADSLCEAIPGGEGATPTRRGRPGWPSPILGAVSSAAFVEWLTITQTNRPESGGGGARAGGDGIQRTYAVDRDVLAIVGIDRVHNPPHGIDRAGPPKPAAATILARDGEQTAVCPWVPFTLPAGATLVIETAGGAGHGFGGYGDIEFDASDWFGSKSDDA